MSCREVVVNRDTNVVEIDVVPRVVELAPLASITKNSFVSQIAELKALLKYDYDTYYTEITYDVDDNPTNIDKWTNSSKSTKLFTKTITWVNQEPTLSITVDEITGFQLTVNYTWIDGNVTEIQEVLTN